MNFFAGSAQVMDLYFLKIRTTNNDVIRLNAFAEMSAIGHSEDWNGIGGDKRVRYPYSRGFC